MLPNSLPISLVFADDSALMRSVIRMFLQTDSHITIIGEAASANTLIRLCGTLNPSVVLLDYHMPGPGCADSGALDSTAPS